MLEIIHKIRKLNQTNIISFASTRNYQKTVKQINQVTIILGDKKHVITTELKNFYFYLPKDAGINLKHEIYFIIKHNKLLAEHTTKNEARQLWSKYKHRNTEHEQGKQ